MFYLFFSNMNLIECGGLESHPTPDLSTDTNIYVQSFLWLFSPTLSYLSSQSQTCPSQSLLIPLNPAVPLSADIGTLLILDFP